MKTLDEFVKLFSEQFDETDESQFTPDTVYRDLEEWTSLIGLSVIAMVDEQFEVALIANDFRKANTIAELYQVVVEKLNE